MEQEKKQVSALLILGVVCVPIIFVWFLLKKEYSNKARIYGFTYAALLTLYAVNKESDTQIPETPVSTNNRSQSVAPTVERKVEKDLKGDNYEGKIEDYALEPYTAKGGFEKTIKKYNSRLNEITKFRKLAAEKAIDSGKCDTVVASELSDSSTLKHMKFWVDCNNGERIYLDEYQLKSNNEVLTQKELAISKGDAMIACEKGIKANSRFPNSVDIHHFSGTTYYEAPATHNVRLEMNFDAKNALGNDLPYKAICTFQPGKEGEIEIIER